MSENETRHEARVDQRIADAMQRAARADARVASYEKVAARGDYNAAYYADALDEARVEQNEAHAERQAAERDYGGWSRFFLVQGGHIHSSMNCSTCNNGRHLTQFGWLPELSGLDEAAAVAAHGAILCTVCFPSAPVEWTNHYEVEAARKAAARCPGSGKRYDEAKPRELQRMSKWGYCTGCGTRQTVTPTGMIRAHKAPAAQDA